MKIIVKPLKKNGLSFGFDTSPVPTMRDISNWESIVREMLTFAYLNRPAYLITVQPQEWSLVNFSPDAHETIRENVNGKPYFFYYQNACSAELLENISVGDEDFKRALLWLISAEKNEKSKIYEVIAAMDESRRLFDFTPEVKTEWLFAGFDYAETVYWYNPVFGIDEILQKLSDSAQDFDFELDTMALRKIAHLPKT